MNVITSQGYKEETQANLEYVYINYETSLNPDTNYLNFLLLILLTQYTPLYTIIPQAIQNPIHNTLHVKSLYI